MMHSFLVCAVYVAMVITPCAIATFTTMGQADDSSESNVLEDGFI
jgi:hypothetical protein